MIAPGLYAILDVGSLGDRSPVDAARALLRGGCAALQLRAKHLGREPLLALARDIVVLARDFGTPFIVNDDVSVARECGATGVHLGQQDLEVVEARRLLRPEQKIGLSTHNAAQAREAAKLGADYIGLGPIFATQTKKDTEPVLGLAALGEICRQVTLPVVAIGGITAEHAAEVAGAGATAAAAISAVLGEQDIEQAARLFHHRFLKVRKESPARPDRARVGGPGRADRV